MSRIKVDPNAVLRMEAVTRLHRDGESSVTALCGVSLSVRVHELVAVVGASGSGKTTLLNIAGSLDNPTSGRVWIDGSEVPTLTRRQVARLRRRSVGYVFQEFNLVPLLTAIENVSLPLEIDGFDRRRARETAMDALDVVGLAALHDRYPNQLSGGQQQRVAIARAVVGPRRLILADEPTGALDHDTGDDVMRLLRHRCDAGAAGVFVTHDHRHLKWADRVVRLSDGAVTNTDADEVVDSEW